MYCCKNFGPLKGYSTSPAWYSVLGHYKLTAVIVLIVKENNHSHQFFCGPTSVKSDMIIV